MVLEAFSKQIQVVSLVGYLYAGPMFCLELRVVYKLLPCFEPEVPNKNCLKKCVDGFLKSNRHQVMMCFLVESRDRNLIQIFHHKT